MGEMTPIVRTLVAVAGLITLGAIVAYGFDGTAKAVCGEGLLSGAGVAS